MQMRIDMDTVVEHPCEGCLEEMDTAGRLMGYSVCMACVKARHRAVVKMKCCCGRAKRESDIKTNGAGRRWISCLRCLGKVRQIS